ncbi:MAG: hypothetical protein J6Q83_08495 [Clostridia bacterium]|nr:hypothetical protein [Clostridia bacterium]
MKCPNCGKNIGRFELAPNCKQCGVNIFYSQQKDLLTRDAKMCELEYAGCRILVSKLKATFIKGALPIMRIVAMVVAIASIFVPFATVTTQLPLMSVEFSFGAWGIYSAFSDGTLGAVISLLDYTPREAGVMLALLGLIVLIFLSGLGIFLGLLLSFINIQRSARAMRALALIGAAFCVVAAATSLLMPSIMSQSGFLAAKPGIGAFGCFAVLVFIFVLNQLVIKKNIQPEIKEVDLQRVEMKKRVKAGEVSLDDLTLPVFETEEERQKRLEEQEKRNQMVLEAKGGEADE